MNTNAKTSNAITRPEKKSLAQKVPKGVSSLLGDSEEPVTELRIEDEKKQAQQPAKKVDKRITTSLRYRESYVEKLDLLYLNEKIKRRKVTKADLVEEALDWLFEQYNV